MEMPGNAPNVTNLSYLETCKMNSSYFNKRFSEICLHQFDQGVILTLRFLYMAHKKVIKLIIRVETRDSGEKVRAQACSISRNNVKKYLFRQFTSCTWMLKSKRAFCRGKYFAHVVCFD